MKMEVLCLGKSSRQDPFAKRLHWDAPALGYVEDIVSLVHYLCTLSSDVSRSKLHVRDLLFQQENSSDDKLPSSTPKIEDRLSRRQGEAERERATQVGGLMPCSC